MLKNPLALVGILTIVYYLSTKTGDKVLDGFSVKGVKVKAPSLTIEGATIDMELEVQNDNVSGGTVKNFNGSLLLGNKALAALSFNQEVEILGMGVTTIPVQAKIKYSQISIDLVKTITDGTWKNGAKVVGTLTLKNGLAIPVEKNIIQIG